MVQDVFLKEPPLPSEFGASKFAALHQVINRGKRDSQKFAHFLDGHHSFSISLVIHGIHEYWGLLRVVFLNNRTGSNPYQDKRLKMGWHG